MIIKQLTEPQKTLFDKILLFKYVKNSSGIFEYDDMKKMCCFKTFDSTFNSLLSKGYLHYFTTNDFSNKFIITPNT